MVPAYLEAYQDLSCQDLENYVLHLSVAVAVWRPAGKYTLFSRGTCLSASCPLLLSQSRRDTCKLQACCRGLDG